MDFPHRKSSGDVKMVKVLPSNERRKVKKESSISKKQSKKYIYIKISRTPKHEHILYFYHIINIILLKGFLIYYHIVFRWGDDGAKKLTNKLIKFIISLSLFIHKSNQQQ